MVAGAALGDERHRRLHLAPGDSPLGRPNHRPPGGARAARPTRVGHRARRAVRRRRRPVEHPRPDTPPLPGDGRSHLRACLDLGGAATSWWRCKALGPAHQVAVGAARERPGRRGRGRALAIASCSSISYRYFVWDMNWRPLAVLRSRDKAPLHQRCRGRRYSTTTSRATSWRPSSGRSPSTSSRPRARPPHRARSDVRLHGRRRHSALHRARPEDGDGRRRLAGSRSSSRPSPLRGGPQMASTATRTTSS